MIITYMITDITKSQPSDSLLDHPLKEQQELKVLKPFTIMKHLLEKIDENVRGIYIYNYTITFRTQSQPNDSL